MKFLIGELDSFISPVTGKLVSNTIIPLQYNYILIGAKNNYSISSPALIDVWLEIKNINSRLGNTHFILQTSSPNFFNSQALDELANNLLSNSGGIIINAPLLENNIWIGDSNNTPQPNPTIQVVNLPNLTQNYFWIGNSENRPIESNTFPSGSLPDLTYQNIWIGDSSNRPQPNQRIGTINLPAFFTFDPTVNYGIYNLYTGGINLVPTEPIAPSTTLRVDRSNLPNLSKGKIWMGVVNYNPPIINIGVDGVSFSGDLNWDARGFLFDSYAVPQETGLDPGTIFMGDFNNPGQILQTGLAWGQMFIGNGFGQITTVGLMPFQLFSGDPAGSGHIIPITILDRTNLPILTLDNLWVGDGLDQAFPIPIGVGLTSAAGTSLNIADTGVAAGAYTSANITVNAQGQILSASDGDGSGGTVTEINLGTGLTGVPNPITTIGEISISDTGVVAGEYFYLTATINAQGQILSAIDNESTITDMQDNIATNTSEISTINTTLFDPVTGIVNAVGVLNTAVFAAFGGIGLIAQITNNTNKISEMIDTSDTYISQIEENTNNISNNSSQIAGIIAGTVPISANFTGVGDVSGSGPLSSNITLTLNTTLNNVPIATGDINVNNHKIINLSDPINPLDAVNLETLESYVSGLPITLEGFVIGGPSSGGILTTSRGLTCTLDVIPAAANVSFDGFAAYDIAPIPDNIYTNYITGQAINLDWFLNFLDNQQMLVGFVPAYIFPTINITGQTQNFHFQNYQGLSQFQISNTYSPPTNAYSQNCFEFINVNSSGFRFKQKSSSISTCGGLSIESFINGALPGKTLMSFTENNTVQIDQNLDMNENAVYDMADIGADLYNSYLLGQGVNLDWLTNFLDNRVI